MENESLKAQAEVIVSFEVSLLQILVDLLIWIHLTSRDIKGMVLAKGHKRQLFFLVFSRRGKAEIQELQAQISRPRGLCLNL